MSFSNLMYQLTLQGHFLPYVSQKDPKGTKPTYVWTQMKEKV